MAENRKSYPLNFKKQVLNILDENNGNISATAKACSVYRKNIRRWKDQRASIEKEILDSTSVKSKFRIQIRPMKAKYPLLEDAIVQFVKETRSKRQTVNGKMICRKATNVFPNIYPDPNETSASNRWLKRMLKRNNLNYRRVTSVRTKDNN